MEEKSEEKKQIIKENRKEMLFNLIIAVFIVLYFMILILGNANIEEEKFETDLQIVTMMLLAITIIILEKAYKKSNIKIAITGIEALIVSSHTLSITYIIQMFNFQFKDYILFSAGAFAIYYLLKIMIVYTIGKKKYLNSLSDISEIVKEEEPIKKEAVKRKKKEEKEVESEDLEKKEKKTKTEKKKTTKTKKTKTSKEKKSKEKQEDKQEEKPKKRGRPKKNKE